MPEELELTKEDEKLLDKIWDSIPEDEDDSEDEDELEPKNLFLSVDIHGREHRGKGPGGGQFVAKKEGSDTKDEEEPTELTESETQQPKEQKRYTYVTVEDHKIVIKKAINKLKEAPTPTEEEIEAAKIGIERKGANKYRKDLVGNTTNRRNRRNKLLKEFGNGQECPCIYCGLVVTHGTMEQDKIYTTSEGGRYRIPNLVPACGDCNKKRGDMPFVEAIKKVVNYVKSTENN